MSEYIVTGTIVGDNGFISVRTEPIDAPEPEIRGVQIGLELRGWENCEIQEVNQGEN